MAGPERAVSPRLVKNQEDPSGATEAEEPSAITHAEVTRTAETLAAVDGGRRRGDGAARPAQLEAVFSPVEIDFFERLPICTRKNMMFGRISVGPN